MKNIDIETKIKKNEIPMLKLGAVLVGDENIPNSAIIRYINIDSMLFSLNKISDFIVSNVFPCF